MLAGLQDNAAAMQHDASLPQNAAEAEEATEAADEVPLSPQDGALVGARARSHPAASEPDFVALARKHPELRAHVRLGAGGRGSIDFTDFEAARRSSCPARTPAISLMAIILVLE